jgi:hypothetical protein
MPGRMAAQLIGKRPDAEIRVVIDQRIGRHMLQLPGSALREKKENKNFFIYLFITGMGLNCSGRGKYITSTDISPPSTGLFPVIPEYNLPPLLNLLILACYESKESKTK